MFSRPHKPFDKGKVITANDLNWLKREATKILVGGPGMAVTRVGGRTVLSRVGSQSVRQPGNYFGNVYKLASANGRLEWAFDTGAEAYCVFSTGSAVYVGGSRSNTWDDSGAYATVWKLSPNGRVLWSADLGVSTTGIKTICANDTAVYVGYTGTGTIKKLDASDGSVLATVSGIVLHGSPYERAFWINSTHLFTNGSKKYDLDLALVASGPVPLVGPVGKVYGISVSDANICIGYEYDGTATTGLVYADTSFGVDWFKGIVGGSFVVEGYGNNQIWTSGVFASHLRLTPTTDTATGYMFDLSGTELWSFTTTDAEAADHNAPPAVTVDETSGVAAISFYRNIFDWAGTTHPTRTGLFGLDIDTGDVIWNWSNMKSALPTQDGFTSVHSDNTGFLYCTSPTSQEPAMKVAA